MVRRDGQLVWVLDDALVAEVDSYGVVQHGLLYEITERKRTELLLAEHAVLLERVAQGETVTPGLIELAGATEAISGAARCVIAVAAAGPDGPAVLLSSAGELTADELLPLGPARYQAAITAPDGTALGTVRLHYPAPAVVQERDQELAGWAAGLATVAVVRAAEHASASTSMSLLEATLESTADGILVVSATGQVLGYNQKMIDMWHLDPEVLKAGRDEDLRASVLSQLVEPDSFTRGVDRLMATPLACSHDTLEFLDGRYYERYSQPQVVDGEPVGRVWSFRDMTEHRKLEQELRAQAFTDPLTPLPNRSYFIGQLTAALASASRPQTSVAVLLLDLDDFKTVNDSLGHVVGDGLLIAVADRLRGCLRVGDLAARLGGDEFVVLLDRLNGPDDAVFAAERLLAAVSRPLLVEGQSLTIRASIGIAMPNGEENASDLLRNADLAMYTAKRDGGGRCFRYAPPMHAEAMARLALKAELERALDDDELIVHYQPVIDLHTFDIVSVEALVRWPHPRARADPAGRVHPAGRGVPADRPAGFGGAATGLRAGRALAAEHPVPAEADRQRQPVAAPAVGGEPGRRRPAGVVGGRAAALGAGAGDHRDQPGQPARGRGERAAPAQGDRGVAGAGRLRGRLLLAGASGELPAGQREDRQVLRRPDRRRTEQLGAVAGGAAGGRRAVAGRHRRGDRGRGAARPGTHAGLPARAGLSALAAAGCRRGDRLAQPAADPAPGRRPLDPVAAIG